MGNKVGVALLSVVAVLLVAVLAVGVLFLTRDTRSKATQLREANYDRCVARVEEVIRYEVGDYEIVEKEFYGNTTWDAVLPIVDGATYTDGFYGDGAWIEGRGRYGARLISATDFSNLVLSLC